MKFLRKMNPFKNKRDMVVGIQLTDDLVRFVGLRNTDEGIQVYLYGEEYLSAGAIVDGLIQNAATVGFALATMKKKYDLDKVHIALPEEQSFIFHTTVNKSEESDELQSMIEDHILSYLKLHAKLPSHDLVCEYDVINEEDEMYELAVWVTPRSVVDAYLEVIESAGLEPETFEVGSRVVTEAVHSPVDGESTIIVDFGTNKTHVSVESGGTTIHSTTINVGEGSIIPVIKSYLDISDHEAQRIKKKYGVLRSHREPALLSEIVHELSPIIDYIDRYYVDWHTRPYQGSTNKRPITNIKLHGEGSHVPGLRDHFASATRIPTDYLDVWARNGFPKDRAPDVSFEDSLRYATAMSAALYAMKGE